MNGSPFSEAKDDCRSKTGAGYCVAHQEPCTIHTEWLKLKTGDCSKCTKSAQRGANQARMDREKSPDQSAESNKKSKKKDCNLERS